MLHAVAITLTFARSECPVEELSEQGLERCLVEFDNKFKESSDDVFLSLLVILN